MPALLRESVDEHGADDGGEALVPLLIEVEIVGDACATSVGMILEDDTHET